ncbi:hypothetical protein DdX_03316 [Ditylenchus destructor]|uniref:Uncharacterized protein n=1 Tax=Ditylenchus destructor TaxID=166010 RepID=A0AAD4NCU8_9BILA|nr:hypothetical protein DdX_03316 [Ditylenchus destructor]
MFTDRHLALKLCCGCDCWLLLKFTCASNGPIAILTAFPDVEDPWTLRHVYRCVDGFSVSISLHCSLLSAKPVDMSMDYDASPFLLTWARSLDRQDLHPHIIIPEFVSTTVLRLCSTR